MRVEFATRSEDGLALLHARVPRGQTIESAELVTNDPNDQDGLPLTIEPVALDATQWLVIDASSEMVNFETAVQAALQRFFSNNTAQTGIIYYGNELRILNPTDSGSQIDSFVETYSAAPDGEGCVSDALTHISELARPVDRSWHIMLITATVVPQTTCTTQEWPQMPAPVDIISLAPESEEVLDDLIVLNGGSLVPANLRTLEARFNEIRIQWGQPIFQLSTDALTTPPLRATLNLTLSNAQSASVRMRFRTYNLSTPIEPTAIPTQTAQPIETVSTSEPEATTAAAAPTGAAAESASAAAAPDNMSLLLVLGTTLFVIGAVAVAVGLSRSGQPATKPMATAPTPLQMDRSSSFYAALEDTPSPVAPDDTVTRQRQSGEEISETQIAPNAVSSSTPVLPNDSASEYDVTTDDNLLITQVLSDDRFKTMIEQSNQDQEVVGFVRAEGAGSGDYRLTRRGLVAGRGMGCDIQITGDSAISRQHVRIAVQEDDTVTVSRLSATNPVVVGGSQVSNRYPLKPNDVIHLSDQTRLVYIANQVETLEDTDTGLE